MGRATERPRRWYLVECRDAFRHEPWRVGEHTVSTSNLRALMTRDEASEEPDRRSLGRDDAIRYVPSVSSRASDVPLIGSRA